MKGIGAALLELENGEPTKFDRLTGPYTGASRFRLVVFDTRVRCRKHDGTWTIGETSRWRVYASLKQALFQGRRHLRAGRSCWVEARTEW